MRKIILLTFVAPLAYPSVAKGGPDRVSLGLGVREIKAQYLGERVKAAVPMTQLTFVWQSTDRLDWYLQASFLDVSEVQGDKLYDGSGNEGEGTFTEVMLGARWFFWQKGRVRLGLDASAGIFFGEYEVDGMAGPLQIDLKESIWGVSGRLGLCGELSLNRDRTVQLVGFVGYNWSEVVTDDIAHVDLDGWAVSVGFQVSFGWYR